MKLMTYSEYTYCIKCEGSLPSPVAHKEHEVFLPFVQRLRSMGG